MATTPTPTATPPWLAKLLARQGLVADLVIQQVSGQPATEVQLAALGGALAARDHNLANERAAAIEPPPDPPRPTPAPRPAQAPASTIGAILLREMVVALREDPALVLELRALLAPSPPPPRPMTLNIVGFCREMRVGRNKVREWMALGMPHTKSGRTVRIDAERARQWLEESSTDDRIAARAKLAAQQTGARIRSEKTATAASPPPAATPEKKVRRPR